MNEWDYDLGRNIRKDPLERQSFTSTAEAVK
jgi:hypothetical protein